MARMRAIGMGLLLAGVLVGAAGAQKPRGAPAVAAPKALGSALETISGLPKELAGWQRLTITDFGRQGGDAGLGVAVEYRPLAGGAGVATIYAYDRGLPPQREGIEAPVVAEELAKALAGVTALGEYRGYRVVAQAPGPVVAGLFGRPGLRCETLRMAFSGGPEADGLICLGVLDGRLLKLRMTLPAGADPAAGPGFGAALLQVVR